MAGEEVLLPHATSSSFSLVQPVQKMFPLRRLPASLVWSAGVPRPPGDAAATSESGRDEQPAGNSSAERDGLLPSRV